MKKFLIALALAIMLMSNYSNAQNSNSAQTSVAYTQADRDRSIRTEVILEQIGKRMDDMNKRMDEQRADENRRFEEQRIDTKDQLDTLKIAFGMVVSIIIGLLLFLINLVIRERRTIIAPIEKKLNEIDLELKDIKKDTSLSQIMVGLRQLGRTNAQVHEFLKNNNLL